MAAPPGRVIAIAIARGLRPVEDGFNPAANTARRLRFLLPDRLERLHDDSGVDGIDREVAHDRVDVSTKRRWPLRSMLGVAPTALVCADIRFGAAFEGLGPGCGQLCFIVESAAILDRIDRRCCRRTLEKLTALLRLLSRL